MCLKSSSSNSTKGETLTGRLEKGLVQIYTGDGKGKTTAAIGLAVRSVGRDLKVYLGQFMKCSEHGEHKALKRFSDGITLEQFGSGKFQIGGKPDKEEKEKAKKGLDKVKEALVSKEYYIVIADEICVAHHFGLLELEDILELFESRPENVELVLTGRKASEELIERADLVTEMKEIKHPYQKGVEAREGIER